MKLLSELTQEKIKEVVSNVFNFDAIEVYKSFLKSLTEENSTDYDNALIRLLEKEKRDQELDDILKELSILAEESENASSKEQLASDKLVSQIVQISKEYIESNMPEFERVIRENPDTATVTSHMVSVIAPYVSDKLSGVGLTIIVMVVTIYINLVVSKIIHSDKDE